MLKRKTPWKRDGKEKVWWSGGGGEGSCWWSEGGGVLLVIRGGPTIRFYKVTLSNPAECNVPCSLRGDLKWVVSCQVKKSSSPASQNFTGAPHPTTATTKTWTPHSKSIHPNIPKATFWQYARINYPIIKCTSHPQCSATCFLIYRKYVIIISCKIVWGTKLLWTGKNPHQEPETERGHQTHCRRLGGESRWQSWEGWKSFARAEKPVMWTFLAGHLCGCLTVSGTDLSWFSRDCWCQGVIGLLISIEDTIRLQRSASQGSRHGSYSAGILISLCALSLNLPASRNVKPRLTVHHAAHSSCSSLSHCIQPSSGAQRVCDPCNFLLYHPRPASRHTLPAPKIAQQRWNCNFTGLPSSALWCQFPQKHSFWFSHLNF